MIQDIIFSSIFLIFIWVVNYKVSKDYQRLALNLLIFTQVLFLTFFIRKSPSFIISLSSLIVSLFFLFKSLNKSNLDYNIFVSLAFGKLRVAISAFLFISIIIYEILTDLILTPLNYLALFFVILFSIETNSVTNYRKEKQFTERFLFLTFLFLAAPTLISVIIDTLFANTFKSESFQIFLVTKFLSNPLHLILSLLGFNTSINNQYISFEDLDSGLYTTVEVAKSCSGLDSATIFISALISYSTSYLKFSKFELSVFLSFGILISYFANLIRMLFVILAGHYFGIEALVFVHSHLGWLIFSIWVFIFWQFIDRYHSHSMN